MAYGDGGFYFLQPVNNGYGAIDFTPNPYGAIEESKRFGAYRTYFQPSNPVPTPREHRADLQYLKAHLTKLRGYSKTLKKNTKATRNRIKQLTGLTAAGMGSATRKELDKARARLETQEVRRRHLDKAVKRMKKSISVAQGRSANMPTYKKPIFQASMKSDSYVPPDRKFAPVDMPSYQVGDENAPDTLQEMWDAPGTLNVVPPSEDIISDGQPVVAETFYQKNKSMIMMGAAGLGAVAVIMMLRK